MIKLTNALFWPAMGCFMSLSPAPHNPPPCQVSYDAQGHINNVPGMIQADYDDSTGEINRLVVGSGDQFIDFTFVHNRVELAKLKITGAGLSRTTNFVYAYGNTNRRSTDPVSVQWHYDEYKNGNHTESADAKYLLTYSDDPFFVGNNNVISRMIYAYPPHAPVVAVHYHRIHDYHWRYKWQSGDHHDLQYQIFL